MTNHYGCRYRDLTTGVEGILKVSNHPDADRDLREGVILTDDGTYVDAYAGSIERIPFNGPYYDCRVRWLDDTVTHHEVALEDLGEEDEEAHGEALIEYIEDALARGPEITSIIYEIKG